MGNDCLPKHPIWANYSDQPAEVTPKRGFVVESPSRNSKNLRFRIYAPPKFNSSPLKNGGWLEDDPFLLGWFIFRGELLIFGRVVICPNIYLKLVVNSPATNPLRICIAQSDKDLKMQGILGIGAFLTLACVST